MSDDLFWSYRASVFQTQAINITNIIQINLYYIGNNNPDSSRSHDDTISPSPPSLTHISLESVLVLNNAAFLDNLNRYSWVLASVPLIVIYLW